MEPNPKLQFRRAEPADAPRIMEIIREAQAQMRALGSAQWQDGYPALRDIEADIAGGRGVAAVGTGCSPEPAGCTAAPADETDRSGETNGRKTDGARMRAVRTAEPRVIAYAAVVYDGEPAYDAIEGRWLTAGPYVVVHRLAVADEAKRRGTATAFLRHVETEARARGMRGFRIDTAHDNRYMRRLLRTLEFTLCGRIRYRSGERLAYEKPLDGALPEPTGVRDTAPQRPCRPEDRR